MCQVRQPLAHTTANDIDTSDAISNITPDARTVCAPNATAVCSPIASALTSTNAGADACYNVRSHRNSFVGGDEAR